MEGLLLTEFWLFVGGSVLVLGGRRLRQRWMVMFGAGQVFGALVFSALFAVVALSAGPR